MLLEISLRLGGFILLSIQERRNLQSLKQKSTYRIFCLGESTTGGQYPPFLEEILNQRNIGIKFSVVDDGTAGLNTATIMSKLERNLDKFEPQMVIAMMGINDAWEQIFWENRNITKIISFLKSFRVYKLVKLIYLHAQSRVKENQKRAREIRDAQSQAAMEIYSPQGSNEQTKSSIPPEHPLKDSGSNLKDYTKYIEEAELYSMAGRFADAEESFKKAIAINPQNNKHAWGLLIKLYWIYKDFSRAESTFEEALKVNPLNQEAYFWMSGAYTIRGEYSSAEKLLRRALEIEPNDLSVVSTLILVCRLQGRNSETEDLLKKYIKQDPKNEYLYGLLAAFYEQIGRYRIADECYREANKLRMFYYNPETRNNYLKLKSVLDKRAIKLVCMQYPVRSLKPLKEMFPVTDGIIFIDNEKVFKDVLKKNSYETLFKDNFGGEFGHCTDKGNKLLAQHIADVILKEVFNK